MGDFFKAVSKHISKHIGEPATVLHELVPDQPHIDVHIVEPTKKRPFYTLITSGMSEIPMNVPDEWRENSTPHAELMLVLPKEWQMDKITKEGRWGWPVRWLRFLAKYPYKHNSWLWIAHTVPNGDDCEPFSAETKQCCWFVRGASTVSEEFTEWKCEDRIIFFMGLTAIYRKEMDFAMSDPPETLMKLEEKLVEAGVTELVDVGRRSCV